MCHDINIDENVSTEVYCGKKKLRKTGNKRSVMQLTVFRSVELTGLVTYDKVLS
jgi:hypothetical protein